MYMHCQTHFKLLELQVAAVPCCGERQRWSLATGLEHGLHRIAVHTSYWVQTLLRA